MNAPSSHRRRAIPAACILVLASCGVGACEKTTFSKQLGPALPGGKPTPTGAAGAAGAAPMSGGAAGVGGAGPEVRVWAPPTPANRAELLASVAACTTAKLRKSQALATKLVDAANANVAAPTAATDLAVKAAWATMIDDWERLELFQFGPQADGDQPGGKDGRVYVYAWPQLNRCSIDQALVSQGYATVFDGFLIGARGLGAIEYLAFHEAADNGCAATATINTAGTWAALGGELRARRAAYVQAVAADLVVRTRALGDAWDPALGNFSAEFTSPGKVYADQPMAFNAVGSAMFYLDKQLKDAKLGRPLGLVNCPTPTCADGFESPWAGRAKEHVRANLYGFGELYHGCDAGAGVGLEDVLVGIGATDLAGRVRAHLEAAFVSVDALGGRSLPSALAEDEAKLAAVHGAVRQVAIDLRSEVITVLDLEIPAAAEGDND